MSIFKAIYLIIFDYFDFWIMGRSRSKHYTKQYFLCVLDKAHVMPHYMHAANTKSQKCNNRQLVPCLSFYLILQPKLEFKYIHMSNIFISRYNTHQHVLNFPLQHIARLSSAKRNPGRLCVLLKIVETALERLGLIQFEPDSIDRGTLQSPSLHVQKHNRQTDFFR